MDFAKMLGTTVQPLSSRIPTCEANQKARAKAAGNRDWDRDTNAANVARHAQTLAKYRAVMGDEWVTTRNIDARLGYARTSCWDCLATWEKAGIIERRKVGGNANWNRRKGFEWRLK